MAYDQEQLIDMQFDSMLREYGIEYFVDAIVERKDDGPLMELFEAYKGGRAVEIATALRKVCESYWFNMAVNRAMGDPEWDR